MHARAAWRRADPKQESYLYAGTLLRGLTIRPMCPTLNSSVGAKECSLHTGGASRFFCNMKHATKKPVRNPFFGISRFDFFLSPLSRRHAAHPKFDRVASATLRASPQLLGPSAQRWEATRPKSADRAADAQPPYARARSPRATSTKPRFEPCTASPRAS